MSGLPPAALLAGGLGTRIRAVAGDLPKVLLPVEGKPFIAHLLVYLREQGVSETVICLGHAADAIWESALEHAPSGLTLTPSREAKPLGTGGAVALALPRLGESFFIVNGDTFLESSLGPLWSLHEEGEALLTLTLVRSEKAAEKGTVRIDPRGEVLEFAEKVEEGTGLINGGVYAARAELFAGAAPDTFCSLERELIPDALSRKERVLARVTEAPFVDIGLPEDYMGVRDRLPRRGDSR